MAFFDPDAAKNHSHNSKIGPVIIVVIIFAVVISGVLAIFFYKKGFNHDGRLTSIARRNPYAKQHNSHGKAVAVYELGSLSDHDKNELVRRAPVWFFFSFYFNDSFVVQHT